MDALKVTVNDIILNPQYAEYLALVKAARNGAVYGAKVRFPHALVYAFPHPASRTRYTAQSLLRDHIYKPTHKSNTANVSMGTNSMVFLFRSGTLREKLRVIIKSTRQHARNLATFAFLYKSTLLALRHLPTFSQPSASSSSSFGLGPPRKEGRYDTFLAGLVGGYAVFGRGRGAQSSVNQQIVIYVFARVVLALAKLSVQPGGWFSGVVEVVDGSGTAGAGGREGGGGRMVRNAWPVFASLSWAFVMWLFRWYPDTLQASLRSSMKYIYVNADHWDGFRNFLWHNR